MTVLEQVARWVRMEIPDAVFEAWLFAEYQEVELELGMILTSDLASCLGSVAAMEEMRATLQKELAVPPAPCRCAEMGERAVCFTDSDVFVFIEKQFTELRKDLSGFGTLLLCRVCGLPWCRFHDDDDSYFFRLSWSEATAAVERGEWPALLGEWLPAGWNSDARREIRKTFRGFSVI